MRFMIVVKASKDSEAGVMPEEKLFAAMATYHEELVEAGVLLDASGLHPSVKGWRIKYSGANRKVIDGPFTETKELIAGYTLIKVNSREEAMEWSKRFPNPSGEGKECEIEVRQLFELEDFGESKEIDRFRKMEAEGKAKIVGESMKFVCLCYDEEEKLKAMPKSEWEAVVSEVYATNAELRAKGQLITSEALQSVTNATTVRVRNGKVSTTDGPFAETKEQLGGFFLIEARDLNEAIQVAAKLVGARLGCIEVRATMELSQSV